MNQEFTQEQMEQLEAFLLSHMEKDGCMPLDVAQGYLTAVVSGPHMIMPNEWLPGILGDVDFSSGFAGFDQTAMNQFPASVHH